MPRASRPGKNSRYVSVITRQCRFCSFSANSKGIASHERLCMQTKLDEIRSEAIRRAEELENLDLAIQNRTPSTSATTNLMHGDGQPGPILVDVIDNDSDSNINNDSESGVHSGPVSPDRIGNDDDNTYGHDNLNDTASESGSSTDPPTLDSISAELNKAEEIIDSIRIDYHPSSGRESEILSFREYRHRADGDSPPPTDKEPWVPFKTRGDYEYANIALTAGLNEDLNNKLINLIHRIARGESQLSITSHRELQKTWKNVSMKLPAFEEHTISVPYKNEHRTFKVFCRSIWKWALEILKDPRLVSRFNWDAQKIYKFDHKSKRFVRYYDEPWTGDRFWTVQSNMPDGGKPFGFIFYADKNKLSTFGTEKGYPVIVRCANLPDEIRNGEGIGGGIMVGWLPIVPENANDSNKTSFANFKNNVWHRAVSVILDSIKSISKVGCWVECGDKVERQIFPLILIASADYEEQAVMASNRGVKSLAPCTTCEVPSDKLSDLSKIYKPRTASGTKMLVELGKLVFKAKKQEERLKKYGLRPTYNSFWDVGNSDIHRAVSFDRLHTVHSGLFAGHIWKIFKKILKKKGREYEAGIDRGFRLFPVWRNLYHFENVIHITFNDGKKHEDMAKQLLFVAQSVIQRDPKSKIYILLRLLRSLLIFDMYLSFERHTSATIKQGLKELENFDTILKEYISVDDGPERKNWNFPKLHELLHAFHDIIQKGVTKNYNTKPNEKLHGSLRDIYHERTNFRNVASQITKINHHILVAKYIQAQINILDNSKAREDEKASHNEDDNDIPIDVPENHSLLKLPYDDKFHLGSCQKPVSLEQIEAAYKDDIAFRDFRKRLAQFLNIYLPAFGIPLPGNKYLRLSARHSIVEYRYLKVNYLSKVTWRVETDYLRCNPKFYGKPRYDFVILITVDGHIFARLIYLFAVWIDGKPYPIALVQTLDAYLGPERNKDKELGLLRLGIKPRAQAEFVSVNSIERGALVMQDIEKGREHEYLVVDIIDSDMFLRVKEIRGLT